MLAGLVARDVWRSSRGGIGYRGGPENGVNEVFSVPHSDQPEDKELW